VPVASETSRIQYTGNGSTVTAYTVPFYFLANADVKVVLTTAAGVETVLTETTHYTLTGATDPAGGSLTTVSAYDNTHTLTIYREPQATQSAEFQSTGALPATTLTRGLDKLTMLVQSLQRKVARAFRLNDKADAVDAFSEADRENTLVGFDSNGDGQLYDTTALLSLLSLSGSVTGASTAFWADDGERALKVPDFTGQIGLQLDTSALYRSTGTSAGNWSLLALDEDNMASDSAVRVPTQQSVKAYVDAAETDAVATAGTNADTKDAAYLPAGSVVAFAGTAAPTGWLLCYGQAVSRTTYAALFTAISTTYGVGDGSTTFNLPDYRGRVLAGKDDMGGSAASRLTNSGTGNPGINGATLGAAGGVDRHTLTTAQLASHSHAASSGSFLASVGAGGTGTISAGSTVQAQANSGTSGSGEAHPNVQPTIVVNYIIRT
jgi:microcystin-dependent protein